MINVNIIAISFTFIDVIQVKDILAWKVTFIAHVVLIQAILAFKSADCTDLSV